MRFDDVRAVTLVPHGYPARRSTARRRLLSCLHRTAHGCVEHRNVDVVFTCTRPAEPTIQHDDDRVRITRWDFEPGAATGWHEHAFPYCIVMVLGGTLVVHDGEKETRVAMNSGDAYARPRGITHDVMNGSDHPIAFVEVEMKR